MNRYELQERVQSIAEATLAKQKYVRPIDVLLGLGWLDPKLEERWRKGQVDCLERVVHANLSRISKAMKYLRIWAVRRGLRASKTAYVRRVPGRPNLRFSKSGKHGIEQAYRTHWVLSRQKNSVIAGKQSATRDHRQAGGTENG